MAVSELYYISERMKNCLIVDVRHLSHFQIILQEQKQKQENLQENGVPELGKVINYCFFTIPDMAQLHSLIALQQFMRGLGEDMDEAELVRNKIDFNPS